ncbi:MULTISPECIES: NAD-dependent epimerase/dehydratase family protein [Streptomycetaceae]|uniref:JadW2 n=1 Tax=Streptantibioticus cattleyicolor (strain ATCC 35852 / DSM 46488 / JCM 4925 / NBRC 14057 / NRRL 8057) TaxID=1003195 RepID=F8JX73_STREN|nr:MULTISPECIES: NAD-dependent epimerase/dehydratase family protein [Streptomycetaceae]AEW94538.1 JadW2 [Streptantibioticus cattleyicolor NRRL 8057 = DSM 46488]MYS59178.1 NAD-dependent epimerase/dehydratase family protein [Streptomyces sp. SID5468]CCB74897.1 JadW2 [Streptantibioticus cattleyicolor NRRL 8057 = DSM 46488]
MPGTIVITGASGFIGSRVAAHARHLPEQRLRLVAHRKPVDDGSRAPAGPVETVPGDLSDPASLRGLCEGAEVLIHCASQIGGPAELCRAVNTLGTEALLAEARRGGVRRVVYLSTAAVYGRGPFRAARPEELAIAPVSETSRTRAAAEEAVLSAGGTVLRPHIVHGPGDRWVAPRMAELVKAVDGQVDGWQARMSVIDADTLARALLATALAPAERLTAPVYHAAHPEPEPVGTVLRAFAEAASVPWPHERIDYAEAARRLAAQGRSTHDLDMVVTDHWFAADALWRDLALPPGPGFTP